MRWNGSAWSIVPSPDTANFENHLNADRRDRAQRPVGGRPYPERRLLGRGAADPALERIGVEHRPQPDRPRRLPGRRGRAGKQRRLGGRLECSPSPSSGTFLSRCTGTVRVGPRSPCPAQRRRVAGSSAWPRSRPPRCTRSARRRNIPSLVMRWNGQSWATETTPTHGHRVGRRGRRAGHGMGGGAARQPQRRGRSDLHPAHHQRLATSRHYRVAEPRQGRGMRHRGGVTWTAFGLAVLLAVLMIIVV